MSGLTPYNSQNAIGFCPALNFSNELMCYSEESPSTLPISSRELQVSEKPFGYIIGEQIVRPFLDLVNNIWANTPSVSITKVTDIEEDEIDQLKELAKQGDLNAQFDLGIALLRGNGVGQNEAEAAYWFRLAAEQGHAEAQYRLGRAHMYGRGVEENEEEAIYWYRIAAAQNHVEAQQQLGFIFSFGMGVERNYKEAAYWYREATKSCLQDQIQAKIDQMRVRILENFDVAKKDSQNLWKIPIYLIGAMLVLKGAADSYYYYFLRRRLHGFN